MKKKILLVDDKSTIGKVAGVYLGKEYDFTYLYLESQNNQK